MIYISLLSSFPVTKSHCEPCLRFSIALQIPEFFGAFLSMDY